MDAKSSSGKVVALLLLSAFVALASQGCAQTQAEIKAMQTRTLQMDFDEAYSAMTNLLLSEGYVIDVSDKEAGILTTRRSLKGLKLQIGFLVVLPIIMVSQGENEQAASILLTPMGYDQTLLRVVIQKNGKAVRSDNLATKAAELVTQESKL